MKKTLQWGYREGGRKDWFPSQVFSRPCGCRVSMPRTSRQCFLVQPHTANGEVPAQSEQTGPSTRRNGPRVTGPASGSFDHGCCNASVGPTGEPRTAGSVVNSGLGLSPHRVLRATRHLQRQPGPDQAVHCWTAMGGSGVVGNLRMHECRWSLQLTDRERFLLGARDQG